MKEEGKSMWLHERERLSVLLLAYVYMCNSKIKTILDINFSVSISASYKKKIL